MSVPPRTPSARSPSQRYRRWLLEALILIGVLVAVHAWQTRNTAHGVAPALDGVDLDGTAVSLAALRGQPVLVHFWATWCPVCRAEQDNIAGIAADHPVLSVVLEDTGTAELQEYMRKANLDFPVLRDPDGVLAARYGVRGVPASFIVDADGTIRFTEVGYTTEAGLRLRLWLAANSGSEPTEDVPE